MPNTTKPARATTLDPIRSPSVRPTAPSRCTRRAGPTGGESTRRELLRRGLVGVSAIAVGPLLARCGGDEAGAASLAEIGPLGDPDANGLRLPAGFRSRVLAVAGETVAGTDYTWLGAPDGGAVFPMDDGGWVYVANAELLLDGGAQAIRFDAGAKVVDAYRILDDTTLNCAGGATPWGTWLSCEETASGRVHECDPTGASVAIERPALGTFKHEAVAVDPTTGILYLTEDETDGRFYRFVPDAVVDGVSDLSQGALEVMRVLAGSEGPVAWEPVPDRDAETDPTREQVPTSTAFNGGEGIAYADGFVYFTTKGDGRVWAYSVAESALEIVYDPTTAADPILDGVDNLAVTSYGDLLVCEDHADMQQIVAITAAGELLPIVQLEGHTNSEITGIAIDPSGRRIYFSSQRGVGGVPGISGGITYEVTLPFAL